MDSDSSQGIRAIPLMLLWPTALLLDIVRDKVKARHLNPAIARPVDSGGHRAGAGGRLTACRPRPANKRRKKDCGGAKRCTATSRKSVCNRRHAVSPKYKSAAIPKPRYRPKTVFQPKSGPEMAIRKKL